MEQNKNKWGSDVCSFIINSTPLSLMHITLNNIGDNKLTTTFGEHSLISSEECARNDSNDIFQKRVVRAGTADETKYYEGLLAGKSKLPSSEGEYVTFAYHPYKGNGVFDNVIFRHTENGKEVYCKAYTDQEIDEIVKADPAHPLISIMTKTLSIFGDIPQPQTTNEQSNQPQKI